MEPPCTKHVLAQYRGACPQCLLVAHVYLFFKFSHNNVEYLCALVHWYSMSDEPDASTGYWVVQPESTRRGLRHMSVIHIDSIVRGAHLLPVFPSDKPVYVTISPFWPCFQPSSFLFSHQVHALLKSLCKKTTKNIL